MAAALKLLPMLPDIRVVHEKAVNDVAFSPDGGFLATASDDGTVRLIDAKTGRETARITVDHPAKWVRFSPNGRFLATMSEEQTEKDMLYVTHLLATDTGRKLAEFSLSGSYKEYAVFSPDSRFFAAATSENELRLFAAESGSELLRVGVPGNQGWVSDLLFSNDSRFLAATVKTGSSTMTGHLISMESAREISRIAVKDSNWIRALAFSPDGEFLAAARSDSTARLISTATGKEVKRFEHSSRVNDVDFSPDGRFFATAGEDGTARLLSATNWRELARIMHRGRWV